MNHNGFECLSKQYLGLAIGALPQHLVGVLESVDPVDHEVDVVGLIFFVLVVAYLHVVQTCLLELRVQLVG